jgi:pentatricopeptide repeat protein
VEITLPMWTTMIASLVRKGATQTAFEEFNRIRTWKSVKPDTVLFTLMIKSCLRNSECEKALNLFNDLEISGNIPSDVTYTTLMQVFARRADFAHKTFEFFDRLQCEEFPITQAVAEALLTACASLGDFRMFRKYSDQIKSAGYPFTRAFF